MRTLRLWVPGVVLLLTATRADARQARITGTVTNQQDAPIASAQVRVQGMTIGATTDEQGRFVVTNVPNGTVPVVARRIGIGPGDIIDDALVSPSVSVQKHARHSSRQLGGTLPIRSPARRRDADDAAGDGVHDVNGPQRALGAGLLRVWPGVAMPHV